MTSTQVNANADDNKNIRNESGLAGGRATINKADNGMIMARPTKEELDILKPYVEKFGAPTIVTDIFKVRNGAWSQTRIWSSFDAGTLRKEDLFITNSRLEILEDFEFNFNWVQANSDWSNDDYNIVEEKLKEMEKRE